MNKIILITVDALRYDASRLIWPYFNIVFTQHYISNNWTLPVAARLLTGKLDTGLNYYEKMFSKDVRVALRNGLKVPTVAKYLKDAGWITYGKTEGLYVSANYGFGKPNEWTAWEQEYTADGSKLYESIFLHDKKEFRYYHDYQVHGYLEDGKKKDYTFVKIGDNILKGVKLYCCETIEDMENWERDYWWRAAGLYEILHWIPKSEAVVILTSDHGECFYEYYNDYGHAGCHMVDEVAHVPLLIHWPGKEKKRVNQFTRDIDVTPTILDIAGIPQKLDGLSLVPLIEEKKTYKSTLMDQYVHRCGELWRYFFSPTTKTIEFVKELK